MKKFRNFRSRYALGIALIVALAVCYFGCEIAAPPGGNDSDLDWYMDIELAAPVSPQLITVDEYRVTRLLLEVIDPEGQTIQVIRWEASQGPRRYQIPISMEGEHELIVTHIGTDGEETIEASESAKFNIQSMVITEVTVVPGAIGFINIDAPLQIASDIARTQLLPAVLEETQAEYYSLLRMDTVLPRGTRIFADSPTTEREPEVAFELEENGYLFYLDLDPGAYFGHPVKYFIVNEKGETKVFDAEWWPKVDEKVPEQFTAATPSLKYVVQRNVTTSPLTVGTIDWKIRPDLIQILRQEAFICVQGLTPSESLYSDAVATYNNGYSFFDLYKGSFSTVVGLTDYSADDVLIEIDSLANAGYDTITIYIIAHGNVNYVRLGGVAIWASQFASTMASHSGVEFNFLVGSCHSGSFLDDLSAISNVRVVKSACLTTESAYGDKDSVGSFTDYNSSDTGSEWTSSVLKAAELITTTPALWNIITSNATTYGVPTTCVLLNEAGYLAVGANRGLPISLLNYDITNRVGWSTPDHYASWEALP